MYAGPDEPLRCPLHATWTGSGRGSREGWTSGLSGSKGPWIHGPSRRFGVASRGLSAGRSPLPAKRHAGRFSRLGIDDAVIVELRHLPFEGPHPLTGGIGIHEIRQLVVRSGLDRIADLVGRNQNLECRHPALGVLPRQELLGHDPLERFSQPNATDVPFLGQHHRNGPFDCRQDIRRRHGGDHQQAGLGRGQHSLERLPLRQVADHDHVRVLPHRGLQPHGDTFGIDANLALGHRTLQVAMQKLNRAFDGDDMAEVVLQYFFLQHFVF